jgi:hypothetical protein
MRRRAFHHQLRRPDVVQSDVDREIALHLELRVAQLMERGLSRDEATRVAHERFGPVDDTRALLGSLATTRETRMELTERIDALRQDLGYTFRQIRRAPGFALAVIATLGLGIGANATMFGAIDQLLLRPPAHVDDPARVVTASLERKTSPTTQYVLSFAIYHDLRLTPAAFQAVGLFRAANMDVDAGAQAKSVSAALVSADFFRALGTRPIRGRFFNETEAGDAPAEQVAIVSYDYWQRELNGDESVVGRSIMLAGRPHAIIGVAPQHFRGLGLAPIDVFAPVTDGMSAPGIASLLRQRQTYSYTIVARLQPGISIRAAEEEATAAMISGDRQAGKTERQIAAASPRIRLTSARPRDARRTRPEARISVLLGTVSLFVLLLACANVVNLQLARAVRRRREIALRVALGVSRSRLIRQLVFDCMVLAVAGGALGVIIAQFGGALVRRTLLGASVADVSITDLRMLAFTAYRDDRGGTRHRSASGARSPPLRIWRRPSRRAQRDRRRVRRAVSALRCSSRSRPSRPCCWSARDCSSSVCAGSRQCRSASRPIVRAVARPNFSGRRSAELPVDDPTRRAQIVAQFERLRQVALQTPGVSHAALALTAPFEGGYAVGFRLPGRDSVPITRAGGPYYNAVSGDYFAAIGARIVQGRAFTESDQAGASVAIVNETAARLWWPGESAIGKCMQLDDASTRCSNVVGRRAEHASRPDRGGRLCAIDRAVVTGRAARPGCRAVRHQRRP